MGSHRLKRLAESATSSVMRKLSTSPDGRPDVKTDSVGGEYSQTRDGSITCQGDHPITEANKITLIYLHQMEIGIDTDENPISSKTLSDGTRRSVYLTGHGKNRLYSNCLKPTEAGVSARSVRSARLFNDGIVNPDNMSECSVEGLRGTHLEEFPPGSNVSDGLMGLTEKEKAKRPEDIKEWIKKRREKFGSRKDDFNVVFAKDREDFLKRGEEYNIEEERAAFPNPPLDTEAHGNHLKDRWGDSKIGEYEDIEQPEDGYHLLIPVIQSAGSNQSQDDESFRSAHSH